VSAPGARGDAPGETPGVVEGLPPVRVALLFGLLILMGAGWGITQPLAKIAVSEGYRNFGIIFWQTAIGAVLLTGLLLLQGRRLRRDRAALRLYVFIALIGTVLPHIASYEAAIHLPAGIISILLSLIPMMAFPLALALGNDRFSLRRFGGLAIGLAGVLLIVLPDASLPDPAMLWWVPVALVAPMFYAFEGNYVARWGTAGLGPIEVLAGASIAGTLISLPLALGSGHFIDPRGPWGAPDAAVVASALIHAVVYTTYVWMVGRAGPTFAVQVSYLVTLFGVFWALLLLQERYSATVWAALALMLLGMALVQPRPPKTLGKPLASLDADGRAGPGPT